LNTGKNPGQNFLFWAPEKQTMGFEAKISLQQGEQTILLSDNSNGTNAEIYAFGGLLNAFNILLDGAVQNLVDGFANVSDAREQVLNGFRSTKLSPFVCRMRKGAYHFNGKDFRVSKYFMGEHAIHGLVFDALFSITDHGADDKCAFVELGYDYTGTDPGYPFPYQLFIRWQLESGNKLTVSTRVKNQSTEQIPYTDGWHPYFTLGGKVDECTLQFDSNRQYEYDADLLPTGKLFTDTRFENGSLLKGIELDNSFELNTNGNGCLLNNNRLKLQITPDQNYPILQLYIPPHRNSIAIENLSGAPDNFNNHIHLVLLQAGEERTFSTSYIVNSLESGV
jgi:aldose 1-epimerase